MLYVADKHGNIVTVPPISVSTYALLTEPPPRCVCERVCVVEREGRREGWRQGGRGREGENQTHFDSKAARVYQA